MVKSATTSSSQQHASAALRPKTISSKAGKKKKAPISHALKGKHVKPPPDNPTTKAPSHPVGRVITTRSNNNKHFTVNVLPRQKRAKKEKAPRENSIQKLAQIAATESAASEKIPTLANLCHIDTIAYHIVECIILRYSHIPTDTPRWGAELSDAEAAQYVTQQLAVLDASPLFETALASPAHIPWPTLRRLQVCAFLNYLYQSGGSAEGGEQAHSDALLYMRGALDIFHDCFADVREERPEYEDISLELKTQIFIAGDDAGADEKTLRPEFFAIHDRASLSNAYAGRIRNRLSERWKEIYKVITSPVSLSEAFPLSHVLDMIERFLGKLLLPINDEHPPSFIYGGAYKAARGSSSTAVYSSSQNIPAPAGRSTRRRLKSIGPEFGLESPRKPIILIKFHDEVDDTEAMMGSPKRTAAFSVLPNLASSPSKFISSPSQKGPQIPSPLVDSLSSPSEKTHLTVATPEQSSPAIQLAHGGFMMGRRRKAPPLRQVVHDSQITPGVVEANEKIQENVDAIDEDDVFKPTPRRLERFNKAFPAKTPANVLAMSLGSPSAGVLEEKLNISPPRLSPFQAQRASSTNPPAPSPRKETFGIKSPMPSIFLIHRSGGSPSNARSNHSSAEFDSPVETKLSAVATPASSSSLAPARRRSGLPRRPESEPRRLYFRRQPIRTVPVDPKAHDPSIRPAKPSCFKTPAASNGPWSSDEFYAMLEGLAKYGDGQYQAILALHGPLGTGRIRDCTLESIALGCRAAKVWSKLAPGKLE